MIIATHGILASAGGVPFVGLLDLYPSAAAAYSLRKLRSAYTGSAIRVRRSSDNTEQNIGFTALGNLDTSSLTSFCGSSNGFITTWYDQSGNARNATQTTAANQPQIVSSGSVLNINSKPSLKFDGSNDNLGINYKVNTNTIAIETVQKYNAGSGMSAMIAESTGTLYFWADSATTFANYYQGYNRTTFNTNQLIQSFYMQTGGGGFYQNGSSTATFSQGGNGASSLNLCIGDYSNNGGLAANCNFQEFIIWESNQSSNRTGIQSNINTYYGIY